MRFLTLLIIALWSVVSVDAIFCPSKEKDKDDKKDKDLKDKDLKDKDLKGKLEKEKGGCFFGIIGDTMHIAKKDQCKEKCALFPLFSPGYTCGPCPDDSGEDDGDDEDDEDDGGTVFTLSPTMAPTLSPVAPVAPTPVTPDTPAPVNPVTPAPMNPVTPAPVNPVTPAPVNPVTPAPVNPVTPAPVAPPPPPPPPVDVFDITLDFDTSSVPFEDISIFRSAAARWESVISEPLADVPSNFLVIGPASAGCNYPAVIDDVYICVFFGPINNSNVLGVGAFDNFRANGGLPITGSIQIRQGATAPNFAGFKPEYLETLFTKLIGHVLGLGRNGECPGINANLQYRAITSCFSPVPATADCLHLQEDCLRTEVMTPAVGVESSLSIITAGWLRDVGYQVDYTRAESFGRADLGANPVGNCICNRRLNEQKAVFDIDGKVASGLSDSGFREAQAFGLRYLRDSEHERRLAGLDSLVHTNSAEAFVVYQENDRVYVVGVRE